MPFKTIGINELVATLEKENQAALLVNVLPEIFFNEAHIPGSLNLNSYQHEFISLAEQRLPNKVQKTILYDSGPDSEAALVAAKKLSDRGWTNILVYKGGLEEWTDAGNQIEGTELPDPERPPDKNYTVNTEKSSIHWSGRSIEHIHTGTIDFKDGLLEVRSGTIILGDLTIDMNTIRSNLPPETSKILDHHLKSEDFFDAERYPTAKIHMEKTKELTEIDSRIFALESYGNLRIKNVTKDIVLHAQFTFDTTQKCLRVSSIINLDRTIWEVKYGSAKFFKKLGSYLVDDIITLDVHISAE